MPPRIIKAKTKWGLFISRNIISGNVRNNRDIVNIFGIFAINFLIFLISFNKAFLQMKLYPTLLLLFRFLLNSKDYKYFFNVRIIIFYINKILLIPKCNLIA